MKILDFICCKWFICEKMPRNIYDKNFNPVLRSALLSG